MITKHTAFQGRWRRARTAALSGTGSSGRQPGLQSKTPSGSLNPLVCVCAIASTTLLVGGCSGGSGWSNNTSIMPSINVFSSSRKHRNSTGTSASPRVVTGYGRIPKGGGRYKLGTAYKVGGRTYVPRHEPRYDRTGVASWYGVDFHGRKTANGEIYDMNALTAAHPTLPLPSYAYVTNRKNGRTVLVRVNDRGPFVHNRIIDLSRKVSQVLGFEKQGTVPVRVTYAGPAPLNGDDSREQRYLAQIGRPSRRAYAQSRWRPQVQPKAYRPRQGYAYQTSSRTKYQDRLTTGSLQQAPRWY